MIAKLTFRWVFMMSLKGDKYKKRMTIRIEDKKLYKDIDEKEYIINTDKA